MVPELDVRKQGILRAIIRSYIETAEPVGSEGLAQRSRLGVSPATIRNEMAALEEMGYLAQPHPSAGRIPTDRGYRMYVDALLEEEPLPAGERLRLRRRWAAVLAERERLHEGVVRALATMTHYASLIAQSHPDRLVFRLLHFILTQPEFSDARAARPVLEALEREDVIAELLEGAPERRVWITIGSEHRIEDLRGCSVVAAAYRIGGRPVGALGIVGPTRMQYARVISLVRYLADSFSDAMADVS